MKKIKGLNQTIKRWKFFLERDYSAITVNDIPPQCGFCKYYSKGLRCSPECPVRKYRGNVCGLDEDYENFNTANFKDEEIPYVMSILVWLFQLKDGVFDE